MKIGIDIDGVILDSEREFRIQSELYDILKLNRNSIVNNQELKFQERYNWTEEEINNFIKEEFLEVSRKCNFMPGAIEIINMLKNEGHELIIITARGSVLEEMKTVAEARLKENNLNFNKYYWAVENKLEICKHENIDIMIDDYYKTCKLISDNNIKTLYFREYPNYELEENEYLKEVHNWGEIYRYIKEVGGNNARQTTKY